MTAERRLHQILLCLALALCLLRFAYLQADFPNHSHWITDEAKFTDEGWWASAAVRHFLIGHWQVSGDYNPAVVVPVWPLMLTALFHLTGVSLVATRALNVGFSVATVALLYLLVRRYANQTTASVAALLLAASPFAFVFSRLATLDTLIDFEFCLLLWAASLARPKRPAPILALGVLLPIMLLTKTTSLVLVPAVLWLLWATTRSVRTMLIVTATATILLGLYLASVLRSPYAEDYHYFFQINELAGVDWRHTLSSLPWQLLRHGMWIDRILYPIGLVVLALACVGLRRLWRNPLFTASGIALAGEAVYILRRQDDYAPRYFLAMLAPLIVIAVLALHELRGSRRALLALTLAVAFIVDTTQVLGFLVHRQYQFYGAAQSIRAIVAADPHQPRLLLGASGSQLSLMTGIPSINDGYSSQDLAVKITRDTPGWYVGWNDMDDDIANSLSRFRLDKVASYHVFDHDDRDMLNLYRMVEVLKP